MLMSFQGQVWDRRLAGGEHRRDACARPFDLRRRVADYHSAKNHLEIV
jgi:hypothetical protein